MKHDPHNDEPQALEDLLPNSDDIARALDRDAADETFRRFVEHAAQNPRLAQAVAEFNQARDAAPASPEHDTLPSVGNVYVAPNAQGFGTPGKPGSSGKGDTLRMRHAGGNTADTGAAAPTPTNPSAARSPAHNQAPQHETAKLHTPRAVQHHHAQELPDPHATAHAGRTRRTSDPPMPKFTMPGDDPELDAATAKVRAWDEKEDREQELRKLERKRLLDYKNARSAEIAQREAAAAAARALTANSSAAGAGSATPASPAVPASPSPSRTEEKASPWQTNGLAAIPIDKTALPSAHAPATAPAPSSVAAPATKGAEQASHADRERRAVAATGTYPRRRLVALVLVCVMLPVLVWLLLSRLMSGETAAPSSSAASSSPSTKGVDPRPTATASPSITAAVPPSTATSEPSAPPAEPPAAPPALTALPTVTAPRPKQPVSSPGRTVTPPPPATAAPPVTPPPPETAAPATPPAPTFTLPFPLEDEGN
jgi:hypothetical protein